VHNLRHRKGGFLLEVDHLSLIDDLTVCKLCLVHRLHHLDARPRNINHESQVVKLALLNHAQS
jgi:hypothetical protein